ncbi:hypothetical protein IKG38_03980 [Candidatus Saccharibacteria bacterium]|nr:hypothetical protein [Candidatus Saccharibacteria bacterium]
MENGQMPQVQPMQPVDTASGMPMVQQVNVLPEQKKDVSGLIKTIIIVIVSLIAATFIGLFIWAFLQYDEARTDVDGQIATAVAIATDKQHAKDEADRLETEKYPYRSFSGPIDYGQLSFEFPKTWNVYIAKDASSGGDFEAYLNPGQVDPISNTTINALRVSILNKSFEDVTKNYERYLTSKEKTLSLESVTVNTATEGQETTANKYTGKIPNTDLNGIILIFRIRDKTVLLRTDSLLFEADFNKLIETITFNS